MTPIFLILEPIPIVISSNITPITLATVLILELIALKMIINKTNPTHNK